MSAYTTNEALRDSMERAVLVLEPDHAERFHVMSMFLSSSWLLVTARTVAEAAEALRERSFLVVMTDLEHCEEIRRLTDELKVEAKIVVTVSFSQEAGAGSTLPAWPYSILRRPFKVSEVFQVLGFAWAAWRHRAMLVEMGMGAAALGQIAA